jgi:hypothetical protein
MRIAGVRQEIEAEEKPKRVPSASVRYRSNG